MKRKRIGFFGGTFDPIHFGHLNLAIQLMEMHRLDQVWICPAKQSPHKDLTPPAASAHHRRSMLALGIEPLSHFKLIDVELNREGRSYTIDTIKFLSEQARKEDQNLQFHLIIGEDALEGLSNWKEVEELIELAPPFIGSRVSIAAPIALSLSSPVLKAVQEGMTKIASMEISSTGIRQRLQKGLYCGHLVPAPVLEYIQKNKLYQ